MKQYQFKYRGKTYECIGDDKDFQIEQFNFLLSINDYTTLKNRIVNQTVAWDCLIQIDGEPEIIEVKKVKEKPKFW